MQPTNTDSTKVVKAWPALVVSLEDWTCQKLPSGERFNLPSATHVRALARAEKPTPVHDIRDYLVTEHAVSLAHAESCIEDLLENNLLVKESFELNSLPAINHWIRRGWFDALLLHCSSRDINFLEATSSSPREDAACAMRRIYEDEGPPTIDKKFADCRFTVALPESAPYPNVGIREVMKKRRSNKPWVGNKIPASQLAQLLRSANTQSRRLRSASVSQMGNQPEVLLQSAFCALESYVVAMSVDGLAPGVYHYGVTSDVLTRCREGDMRDEVAKACIGQARPAGASCAIVITADWSRFQYRYRHPRAYRTLLTSVAELAHKYLLGATAFGLSTFLTPAFEDSIAENLVGVSGLDEGVLYLVAFG